MSSPGTQVRLGVFRLFGAVAIGGSLNAGVEVTDQWSLRPGWNAIFLRVAPRNDRVEAVLDGLDVESVWTRGERESEAEFLSDPTVPIRDPSRWLRWYPAQAIESRFNSLNAMVANRAYLLRVRGGRQMEVRSETLPDGTVLTVTNIQWRVVGVPAERPLPWVPNSLSLRGLPVDGALETTVGGFLGSSAAHVNPVSGLARGIWGLEPGGQWRALPPTERMLPGVAYWIRTEGVSVFESPFTLQPGRLDFGTALAAQTLVLESRDGSPRTLEVFRHDSDPGPLRVAGSGGEVGVAPQWSRVDVPERGRVEWTLRVDRGGMVPGSRYETVYEVRDGLGTRFRVPVTVEGGEVP